LKKDTIMQTRFLLADGPFSSGGLAFRWR